MVPFSISNNEGILTETFQKKENTKYKAQHKYTQIMTSPFKKN